MTETVEKQIRVAIGSLITGVLTTTAKVWTWNVLNHRLDEWPGLFRVNATATHGWVIRNITQPAERKNAQRDRITLDYDVLGFYAFRSGKTGDNSDDEFSVIRAKVYNAIKASPRLNFDNEVEYHELLQWNVITTIKCGEETLHYAQGRLRVHLCC